MKSISRPISVFIFVVRFTCVDITVRVTHTSKDLQNSPNLEMFLDYDQALY